MPSKKKKDDQIGIVKNKRHYATLPEHVARYEALFQFLDAEIDRKCRKKERGVRALITMRKSLTAMYKEVPNLHRRKPSTKPRKDCESGLTSKLPISTELAKFLKVDPKTKLSRVDAVCALCVYIKRDPDETRERMLRWVHLNKKGRNLQDPGVGSTIIPDEALSKLLRYPAYQKAVKKGKVTKKVRHKMTREVTEVVVTSDGLYYWTLQRLLAPHFG